MPRNSIDDAIERRRRERDVGGERLVTMRIDFALNGETLLSVGGVWDRRLDDYEAEAESGVLVEIHEGQLAAVQWFAAWLGEHAIRRDNPLAIDLDDPGAALVDTDPAHAYSALFAGGRRGGKTWIAVALCVAYAIQFPRSIVWLTAPAETKLEEIRRYVAGCVAPEWIDRETFADGWDLCNGSQLMLKGAYNPDALKEGKANLVLLNEGQMMSARAFTVARGAIVDSSGLVIVCANPPVEAKDQQWVTDFATDAAAGRRAAVYLHFNPLHNPHIDRRALLAMKADVDDRTYAIEVLGEFRGPKDAVAYNWVRLANEKPVPTDLPDVTTAFLSLIEEGDGIKQVIGLDVQRIPHIGGPVYRFYGLPHRDLVIAWIVDEVVLEGGDEVEWSDALYGRGYLPTETLIICDASGQWQRADRTITGRQPDGRGRGSFEVLRGEGWRRIKPPDRRQDRNPAIQDRVRAFTSMICSGTGVRRLFVDPDLAPKCCASIRDWRTVHGAPSRTQHEAHLGDASSYPIVRLFPRVLRSEARSTNPGRVRPDTNSLDKATAITATPAELRITPQLRGPSRSARRGSRTRGM